MKRVQLLTVLITIQALLCGLAGEASLPNVTRQEAALLEEIEELARTDTAAAVEHLRAHLPERRPGAALSFTLGNLLTQLEHHPQAAEAYQAASDAWPGFTQARLGQGRALALAGRWSEAEAVLLPLARSETATPETLLLHGRILLHLDRLISAESVYRRAALLSGDAIPALHGLAQCFLRQRRYQETEALARELVQRQPDEPSYWALWADACLALDRPHDAAVRLEAARRQGAATPEMRAQLADLLLGQALPDDARALYEELLERPDLSPETLLRLAEGLLLADAGASARKALERGRDALAARGDPASSALQVAYWRAEARWAEHQGDAEARYHALRQWVTWDPLDATAMTLLGDAYRDVDDRASARLWYERAAGVARDESPWLRLAQLALDAQDHDTALEWLEAADGRFNNPELQSSIRQVRRIRDAARAHPEPHGMP